VYYSTLERSDVQLLELIKIELERGMEWYEERTSTADNYKFVLVSYGKCVYWLGDEKKIVEKGDLLLIPPHVPYYGKHVPTVFHEKHAVVFRLKEAKPDLPLFQRDWTISRLGMYELFLEQFKKLQAEWIEKPPFWKVRCEALLLELLALWSRELERGLPSDDISQHVERMKSYIQNHYREPITKEHLGALLGITPNYAAALFKKVTGQTISEFVHSIRIRTAVYMLSESLLTVSEVASFLGYNDVSYFHKVFKRSIGVPPAVYIKTHKP